MEVLYDDESFVVFIKKPGTVSESICLQDVFDDGREGELYCVHRLDREVGGVTVYARNKETAAVLSGMFAERKIRKTYLALAQGSLEPKKGAMEDLLFHDRRTNKTFVTDRERKGVKKASLNYEVMKEAYSDRISQGKILFSTVRITLNTGRTHQIRVQFASRKHPLLGDRRYGSGAGFEGIALWSAELSMDHPGTGEKLLFTSKPWWF